MCVIIVNEKNLGLLRGNGRVDYSKKDILRTTLVPVLLGDNFGAHLLAARIYLRSGISSYVCDDKRRFADLIDPFSSFYSISSEPGVALAVLGELFPNNDYIPILIPCNRYYERFVRENKEFLESRYIISDSRGLFGQKPMSEF